MYIINFIRGFCMALADSVPGVSGGTIAFVLGFYDKFINSINNIVSGTKNQRKESIYFLFKLGIGWIVGIVISMIFLASLFEKHIYNISSLFIGFIVSSIPIIMYEEKKSILGKYRNIVYFLMGLAIVVLLTDFNPMAGSGMDIGTGKLSLDIVIYIFASGMIAISAMVLPGISGSTILLILGMYTVIITSVKEVIYLNFKYIHIVMIFAVGVVVGLILSVRIIRNLIIYYRSQTIYTVLGLMIGSIYSIVLGPTTLKIPQDAMSFSSFNIWFFIIGILIMGSLQRLKIYFDKK